MILRDKESKKIFHARLVDDGTLDTVISLSDKNHNELYSARFSQEYAQNYRFKSGPCQGQFKLSGLRKLAREAIDDYFELIIDK